ncbi:S1C family serine protease [Patiriisocius hiemis]|uniref:Serine protease n=1 Tax=Patiriisocius hiemis TaxID=3075604 RepID=A0ABU2YAS5_9FLAO|nr:serine protease [Constantimarinum sp. W242]MDT0555291.1 serine protease [Constantimarinum sp. W242]
MKKILYSFIFLAFLGCKERGLDTKLIASKYYKGVVKILLMDPDLEKIKPGSGYMGRGSGFIVTNDGYVFTNKHVIEMCVKGYIEYEYLTNNTTKTAIDVYSEELIQNPSLVKAKYTGYTVPVVQVFYGPGENDYKLYLAEVVATGSGEYDGALLKIVNDLDGKKVSKKFTPVPIGNSDNITQGENLCVYGYPAQFSGTASLMLKDLSTLSLGIMSGYDYVFNQDYGYIKTDAEIHPGNSGGPVFSEDNKVVGIATAKGPTTGIGLIGGLNGMYYISAIDNKAHTALVERGLTLPKRSSSINAIKGERQPIKTVAQINNDIAIRVENENAAKRAALAKNYTGSNLFFSLISSSPNGTLPPKEKRYTNFTLGNGAQRGKIRVFLNNSPNPLKTESILVLIDKLSTYDGKYYKYKDLTLSVNPRFASTYFDFNFYDAATYRVSIYSGEKVFIKSNTLKMSPKKL